MQHIVLASNNSGKIKEFNYALSGLPLEIVPQKKFSVPEIEETGSTFIENAIIKARHASQLTKLPAIADDAGIIVDVLNGKPGIYSARYAGEPTNDKKNINKLLKQLENIKNLEERSAHYYCVIVFLTHEQDPTPNIYQATWEGNILFEPKGENGFGYDPIFYVPTHKCSAAELTLEEKDRCCHRGKALRNLRQHLETIFK